MQGRMGQQAGCLVCSRPHKERGPHLQLFRFIGSSLNLHCFMCPYYCQYPDFVAWGSLASSVGNLVILGKLSFSWGFPGGTVVNLPADAGDTRDTGSMPGLGRSPGGGPGHPLQRSCLENPRDRGTWGYSP